MAPPSGFVLVRRRGEFAWLREDLADGGLEPLLQAPEPLAGAKGRGGVGTLRLPGGLFAVARPYRRGGLLGRWLGDRYLGPGRACRELEVLAALRRGGVAAAAPLAAVARRSGLCWRLLLVTERVEGALPLPQFCAARGDARRAVIEATAAALAAAFDLGLRHPDLHPDNVLVTERQGRVEVVLIDMDRAQLRPPVEAAARRRMLVRMARYLRKHANRLPYAASRTDGLRLLRGLGLDRGQRRREWGLLQDALRRQLRRRGGGYGG